MVGEFHDGGYWSVLPVVETDDGLSIDAGGQSWCAWYNDYNTMAVVRTLDPVTGVPVLDIDPLSIMNPLPFGRVGGL